MKLSTPLLSLLPLMIASCASAPLASDKTSAPWLAHDVYFDLNDDSPAFRQAFVQSCWDGLSKLEGVRFFACGLRDESMTRPENDVNHDVALHVVFEDPAAAEHYQGHPQHLALIEQYKHSWVSVRIFDSLVHGEFTR